MRLFLGFIATISLALSSGCVGEIVTSHAGGDGDVDAGGADTGDPTADGGSRDPSMDAGADDAPDAAPAEFVWKAALMTGDDSIDAFDNAREEVKMLFELDGVLDENMIQLSRDSSEQVGGVRATSVGNFEAAMLDLNVGEGEGCVVFMTSHGNTDGWYIRDQSYLTPSKLDQILDDACGEQPTVALISACYSGVFVDPVAQPNRVILTAARDDRTSFGCSAEATYTYWDGCLIESFEAVDTWSELYDAVSSCIEAKESIGGFTPSLPQAFFGEDVRDLPIFYRE
jgi:hypothetical protein